VPSSTGHAGSPRATLRCQRQPPLTPRRVARRAFASPLGSVVTKRIAVTWWPVPSYAFASKTPSKTCLRTSSASIVGAPLLIDKRSTTGTNLPASLWGGARRKTRALPQVTRVA
jgi:hypothetical protein